MNESLQNIRQRLSAAASATVKFYRANTTLLLSAFTIMSVLLVVWARLGFTLDFGRSSAAVHSPSVLTVVCGATQNVLTWTLPAGHDSNSIIRNDNGADGVWVCGGPNNIAPCTNLNVATYTDTNVQAGHTYAYRHKAWADVASNTVTCAPAASPSAAPSVTPDPNAPPAGTMVGSCTGGATPKITLKYSKLPPPGTTDPVNSNGMNKGTTPPGGTRTVVQLPTFNPTDKGQYWEWTDTDVRSDYTYDYRAKYHPAVGTNTVTIVASPANCGAAPSVTPTATVNPTASATPTPPPGCYYQQVQCVTTPCDPVLVCPSASPTATPEELSCAPVSQTVAVGSEARMDASGGTGSYRWSVLDGDEDVDLDADGDSAKARASAPGSYTIQVTSGDRAATCGVQVVAGSTVTPTPEGSLVVVMTGKNASTNGVESDSTAVRTGQQVEFRVRIANRFNAGSVNNVILRVSLPAGLSYVAGSTAIGGAKTSTDTVTAGGLALGGLGSGQDMLVTFRAAAVASQFPVGTTQVQVVAQAQAPGAQASDATDVVVTRPATGTTGTVQTGPGEALLAAFLVSAIMTLLYVSYTHTSSYKRREVGVISKQRDPLDFRS